MTFNIRRIARVLGILFMILAISSIPSILVSLAYSEFFFFWRFLLIAGICIFIGVLGLLQKETSNKLYIRDGFLLVSVFWILSCVICSIPYMAPGITTSFWGALFEGTSGFTATGATVLSGLDAMPKSLLLWRSLTQWLGGLSVLVLLLSLFSELGIGGMEISKWEGMSLVSEKMILKLSKTTKILILVYFILTLLTAILLFVSGMGFFDAVCHALSTVSTGGFSTHDRNIGYFNNHLVTMVISICSLFPAINFYFYIHIIRKHYRQLLRDSEFKFFILLILLSTLMITITWLASWPFSLITLEFSFFHVVSAITGTGYFLSILPYFHTLGKILLFILIFMGGCSASLSGGLKGVRVLALIKAGIQNLEAMLHPKAVIPVRLSGRAVPPDTIRSVIGFISLYIFVFFFSSFLVSFHTDDMIAALAASAGCLTNSGLYITNSGMPTYYGAFHDFSKLVLSITMLAGRLEIFAIFLLFIPSFWRTKQ